VDRLEKLLPPLHGASYTEVYATGQGKRHGCMIVYRNTLFEKAGHIVIEYDDLDVRQTGDERKRRGSSRRTKNIGLIVGLRQRDHPESGYVVATTHLFWHPS
jgi:RNA exonuclease NGL2